MFASNDRKRLALAIGALGEAYRQPVSEATIRAYEMALVDVPIGAIESAVERAFRERKFFPTVAELRELAGELPADSRTVIAWAAVRRAMQQYGPYQSIQFDDPAITAAIRALGGWERLDQRLETEEEQWVQRDFAAAYLTYLRRGVLPAEARPLGGIHDRVNSAAGHSDRVPAARLVGTTLPPARMLPGQQPEPKRLAAPAAALLASVGRMPEEEAKP